MLSRIEAPFSLNAPHTPSHIAFRGITLLFAALLGMFCFWLVLAELRQHETERLPINRERAELDAQKRDAARSAAAIGLIRGDLWAKSAFTFGDLPSAHSEGTVDINQLKRSLAEARVAIDRAIRYAPTNAGVWLLAANFDLRFRQSSQDPAEPLRMSYYSGPNELDLMPLRAEVTAALPALDPDLRELAKRDLRLLLAHQQKTALIGAYRAASPSGRHLIEEAVGETDPAVVEELRRRGD